LWTTTTQAQIAFGQIDDFQDNTTQNWTGAGPANVPNGQGGAADRYLEVVGNGGFGSGSRVATFNETQWGGDYVSAGVTAVRVDMANFGATDLEMRALLLFTSGGDWTSTATTLVPADGVWRTYTFGLTTSDLTLVGGSGTLAQALSGVGRFMLRHQTGAPAGIGAGTPVVGTLGIDNVTAIPEPASIALLAVGGLALLRRRRTGTTDQSHVSA